MIAVKADMLELGRKQAQLFLDNNTVYCEVLVTADCPRSILVMAYQILVRHSKITPIEDMLQEHKHTAWKTALEIANGRLGRKALIELVQALITLEYFLTL